MSDSLVHCLRVELEHEYFEPGLFRDYRLTPTRSTAAVLAHGGFRWVREGDGYGLYAASETLAADRQSPVWRESLPDSLGFRFEATWPEFGWVTLEPAPTGGDLRVYRVALPARAAAKDTLVYPTGPEGVLFRDLRFQVPGGSSSAVPVVRDGSGQVIPAAVVAAGGGHVVDVSAWGAGYYRIAVGDSPELAVWADADRGPAQPEALLVLTGFPAALTGAGSRRAGAVTAVVRWRFRSRSTVWRYHVFPPESGVAAGYAVEPLSSAARPVGDDGPRFRSVPGIPGPRGVTSVSFESDPARPIPLRARPRERFQLRCRDLVLISPLPLPGPSLVAGRSEMTPCSEMIVHV